MHPEHQLDSVPAQGLAERLAQRRGLARHHPVGALDDHRLAAEPAHDLRDLDAGRPAAEHEQAARDRLHARRLAGAPHALELTQPGTGGTNGSEPVATTMCSAVWRTPVDLDHAGAGQPPVPRSRAMPRPASQCSWPASVQLDTM